MCWSPLGIRIRLRSSKPWPAAARTGAPRVPHTSPAQPYSGGWGALVGAVVSCLLAPGCAPGASATAAAPDEQLTQAPGSGEPNGAHPPPPEQAQVPLEQEDPAQASAANLKRAAERCSLADPEIAGAPAGSAGPRARLIACTWLGAYHASRGEQRQAAGYFREACQGGAGDGCAGLGSVLMAGGVAVTGSGVLRDPEAARAAWSRGCELNSGVACWLAARDLKRGGAGAAERAQILQKKACDLGILEACSDAAR